MNAAKQIAVALPAALLLLSMDRLTPDRFPPAPATVFEWAQAAPTLPARDEGRFGLPGDPLNLVIAGTPAAVNAALTGAGWTRVPTSVRGSLAAGLEDLWDGKTLAAFPPMNDYRLLGRRQSMNWALPVRPLAERHHFRLWNTGTRDRAGRLFWWGSGNYDLRIRWRDFSHVPDPDMDREREFISETLARSPLLDSIVLTPLPQIPREGANDKGYPFRTDGRVAVIVLRAPR